MAVELITPHGKSMIQNFYRNNAEFLKDNNKALMQYKPWDDYLNVSLKEEQIDLD